MKDIAVILPTYKAHKTIKTTLASLVSQMGPSFTVYISVDGEEIGSYDYLLDIFDMLDIKILYSPINRGCGGARQFGMDNTKEPFITFMDTDDIFNSINSLSIMHRSFEEADVVVATPIWRQMPDKSFKLRTTSVLTWMHGKMYRRSFLEKYKIRFRYDEYQNSNEDVGFNSMIGLIADAVTERIKQLNDQAVYIQLDNTESITRANNHEFIYTTNIIGYIMNKLHAFQHAIETLGMLDDDIKKAIVRALSNIYFNYHGKYLDNKQYQDNLYKYSKIFYESIYHYSEGLDINDIEQIETELLENEKEYGEFLWWKETLK